LATEPKILHHKDNLRFAQAVERHQAGALGEAEAAYRDLLKRAPKHVEAAVNLAIILRDSGRAAEAARLLKLALRRRPDAPDIKNEYALVLLKLHRFDEAEKLLHEILAHDPDSYTARSNLGAGLMQAARYDDALVPFREAVARHPELARAHDQLGGAWFALGRMGDAEACYREALRRSPTYAPAWNHLGDVYRVEGAFEASERCYRRAVEVAPNYAMAEWNRAMGLLAAGNFRAGWPAYEARFDAGVALREDCALPKWRGEPLDDRRLLVFAEQGVGDEIMFAIFLPQLAALAKKVLFVCEPRLEALFARSFPEIAVHGLRRDAAKAKALEAEADLWVQTGDLADLLWHVAEGPGARPGGFLAADRAKTEMWRARYAALGPGLKIGVSWRGGGGDLVRHRRSVDLGALARLLRRDGVHAVNLQYGDCADEIARVKSRHGLDIADWPDADPLADLDGFAAQVAALDLIISVDNATVHMAGALGRPVWALLPKPADWRWGASGDGSIWYDSITLFRQARPGDWAPVLGRTADALEALCAGANERMATG
jgi:tetratricopeptide (TPR) repeat protein